MELTPRYAIFAGSRYYPIGGWKDFKYSSDSEEKIRSMYENIKNEKSKYGEHYIYDWFHIVDLYLGKIIEQGVNKF